MACRLFSAKPLSESMLLYYQLDQKEHILLTFDNAYANFVSQIPGAELGLMENQTVNRKQLTSGIRIDMTSVLTH